MSAIAASETPQPGLLAAIGDVHGRDDCLASMIGGMEYLARDEMRGLVVVFLGDIVDRGPSSASALDRVAGCLARYPGSRLMLGNHDDWLLRLMEGRLDRGHFDHWLGQGGAETLASYPGDIPLEPREARRAILECRPGHYDLLSSASVLLERAGHLFVHAGIDPAKTIADQDRDTCLWIRAPFSEHVGPLPHPVVHGHQPQAGGLPTVTENRISLDTGAYYSDRLSAVVIDEASGKRRFFVAGPKSFAPIEPNRLDRGLGTLLDAIDIKAR